MIIDFFSDGSAQAMHRDQFPLGFLGRMEVVRASEIKFNEETQLWDIFLPETSGDSAQAEWKCVPESCGFPEYDYARKIEVAWLDGCRLAGVEPFSPAGIELLQHATRNAGA